MITLNQALQDKEYLVVKITTDWRSSQRLAHLKIFPGVKIKVVQKIHDLRRVAVGIATYSLGGNICSRIFVEPV